MSNFSKQFAIIDKIKSIVKGKKTEETRHAGKSSNKESISQKIASRIQSSAYNISHSKGKKEGYTPAYQIIAEQLCVEDNQIFCAAVYNLAKIAVNDAECRKPILNILNETHGCNEDNKDRANYVLQKINEIKNNK